MSRIGLVNTFSPIPEGTHVFKIVKVEYDDHFGKLAVHLETAAGKTHIERYQLLKANGAANEGALKAFSYFAHTALQDFTVEDIDPEDLVGHYFEADVTHESVPKRDDPTQTVTFVKLGDKRQADGFSGEPAPAPKAEAPKKNFDLDDLLG